MKKTISLILAVLMLVTALPMAASATCAHENTTFYPATKWVCDVPGYSQGTKCDDCDEWIEGHVQYSRPNGGGHNTVYDYTIESTCTSMGMDVYKCTMCDYTYKDWQNKYPYAPHEYEYSVNEGYGTYCYRSRQCVNCDNAQSGRNEETNGRHIDENDDKVCDFCHRDFSGCNHLCHKGGFFWAIVKLFMKMFNSSKNCKCGYPHY